jgi:hypothetical protein
MTENYESAWYGTFKVSPDEPYPTPDSDLYPPEIYVSLDITIEAIIPWKCRISFLTGLKTSYDPNWREFIGTQLVQIVEEFSELIGSTIVTQIEDSLELAAVGSMRRNGSYPEGDNLTPGYSNPALMRAWYIAWLGHRRDNDVREPPNFLPIFKFCWSKREIS